MVDRWIGEESKAVERAGLPLTTGTSRPDWSQVPTCAIPGAYLGTSGRLPSSATRPGLQLRLQALLGLAACDLKKALLTEDISIWA